MFLFEYTTTLPVCIESKPEVTYSPNQKLSNVQTKADKGPLRNPARSTLSKKEVYFFPFFRETSEVTYSPNPKLDTVQTKSYVQSKPVLCTVETSHSSIAPLPWLPYMEV